MKQQARSGVRAKAAMACFVALAGWVALFADEARTWTFDGDGAGKPPAGFEFGPGTWIVVEAADAPSGKQVLEQQAKNPGATYNVALAADAAPADLEVSVRFQSVAGGSDQGGGIVWRAKDAKSYYIARFNPLEANLRAYKVIDGKRTQLANNEGLELPGGWHTLSVVMVGKAVTVEVDGANMFHFEDDSLPEAGRVGLWTKADAQTRFDDLKAGPAQKQ